MRGKLAEIKNKNAQLLAVDPHEVSSAKFMLKDAGLSTDDVSFPLLMDPSLTASSTYGVTGQMRIHTEWSNRPATFIIDKEGVIRFAHRGTRFNDRPTPRVVIAELEKLAK